MSIRNGWPTAAASRADPAISLVRARYADPEDTAPEEIRTALQPSDRALSAASSAEVSTTGSGPVARVTELEPILTTIDLMAGRPRLRPGPGGSRTAAGTGRRR